MLVASLEPEEVKVLKEDVEKAGENATQVKAALVAWSKKVQEKTPEAKFVQFA